MRKITLDDIARLPRPGTVIPGSFAFSPDGEMLTYLFSREGSMSRILWAYDVASGAARVFFDPGQGVTEDNVSSEEALRRERQRIMHTGVTHYAWASNADVVIVPLGGEVWLLDRDGNARKVIDNALDPRMSRDGTKIAFVRDGDLWSWVDGTETRLTHDAEAGVTNGVAEFVAQEEMARNAGFWWSRDGRSIAFQHVDERHIPEYPIPHWGGPALHIERHRYPFAGADNVRWKLGVVADGGGDVRWLDTGDAEYLARAAFHPDGRLFVQLMDRAQQRLELRAFNADGSWNTLLVEESDVWINLHNDLRFVEATGEFIWASERSGSKQLELRAADGSLVRTLTEHVFPVDALLALDEEGRRIAYQAATTPLEAQLLTVSLDDGEPQALTKEPGIHNAVFSPNMEAWVDVHHARTRAPSVTLFAREERVLHEPAAIELDLPVPELFTFTTRDGVMLHGMLYRRGSEPKPLIVRVYGGPHAQTVGEAWNSTVDLPAQYLAQEGFAVVSVDNRGSARRGLAFEAPIKGRMGTVEVDDQVDGVRYAQSQGWVDGSRVGITGWSYGGYMTLMCMLKAPDVFAVGVAGAPVADWDGYDTVYTERYMSTPQRNPDGYREGSAITHAAKLEGKLLIVHGMIDENVHFRHTTRFLDALQKAGKSCDLLAYPSERHGPRSEADRRNLQEGIVGYFKEHL